MSGAHRKSAYRKGITSASMAPLTPTNLLAVVTAARGGNF
eukprot:CAMPEP_0182466350 /NCGR_PEP_ID=MMETSP1319-20130603/11830_1 /TAXON_ID=172717 /ORGANISM="Bolidomonas pacifica, Strain RCC208" /LENGTH=39 /DNA_ID= /DNA_START= /DNA_END= /DNA_ORIENTATION=